MHFAGLPLLLFLGSAAAQDGYRFDFPPAWQVEGTAPRVLVFDGAHTATVAVEGGGPEEPFSVREEEARQEAERLKADLKDEGLQVTDLGIPRIVRGATGEPMVVLEYGWANRKEDGQGRGLRLVRRCGTRVVVEERGERTDLAWVTQVAGTVTYLAPACAAFNLNVEAPTPVSDRRPATSAVSPTEATLPDGPGAEIPAAAVVGVPRTWFFLGLGSLVVALLGVGWYAGSRSRNAEWRGKHDPVRRLPPPGTPSRTTVAGQTLPPGELGAGYRSAGARASALTTPVPGRRVLGSDGEVMKERSISLVAAAEPAHEPTPPPGPRDTGWEAAGSGGRVPGGQGAAPMPPAIPGRYGMKLTNSEPRRRLENALMRLSGEMWLDLAGAGLEHPPAIPEPLADLVRLQNGGRYGKGWLTLLGLERPDLDLTRFNGEPTVKLRFGDGLLFGFTAFGDVLCLTAEGGVELRTLGGARRLLGSQLVDVIEALGRDRLARNEVADLERMARCKAVAGELPVGFVYLETVETASIRVVSFLDAVRT